jgi:hypothetical protein
MTARDAILRAVPVFVAQPEGDLYTIRTALVGAGIPVGISAEIIEFLPLAIARAMLNGMGIHFEDYYIRKTEHGRVVGEKKLLDEPVYREALAMADEIGRMADGVFMAVAGWSSEYRAVSKAMNSGKQPDELSFGPPTMLANNDDRRAFDDTSSGVQQKAKAWWQFWK